MAKIYQNLYDYDNAIENIDNAISKAPNTDYKSSFLWNKTCILHDMGDKKSINLIQEAIDMRKDDKAKEELQNTVIRWSSEL